MASRIRRLNTITIGGSGPVVYHMSKDQRVADNHALYEAQQYALERKKPLIVAFTMFTQPSGRLMQQYEFMVKGLRAVAEKLNRLQIAFILRSGNPVETVESIAREYDAAGLFFDFSPLRQASAARAALAQRLSLPVFEVDTAHVVPVWAASDKEEFAARTIRPKIHRRVDAFLEEPKRIIAHPFPLTASPGVSAAGRIDWDAALRLIQADKPDFYAPSFEPGEDQARKRLFDFIANRLGRYGQDRNKPHIDGLSGMSPYLHYGQISPVRVAIEIRKAAADGPLAVKQSAASYLEELIVRREVAANYCYYQKNYTSLDGARPWARHTLIKHARDPRAIVYDRDAFESAATHDPVWNAAQRELLKTGKMHGYMRMYWAKKILEWTPSPQEAIDIAVYLNDRYSLDGYDANGYTGIMWAIAGVHDRPWFERPIFGTIRYMNAAGLRRKFDLDAYIRAWTTTEKTV